MSPNQGRDPSDPRTRQQRGTEQRPPGTPQGVPTAQPHGQPQPQQPQSQQPQAPGNQPGGPTPQYQSQQGVGAPQQQPRASGGQQAQPTPGTAPQRQSVQGAVSQQPRPLQGAAGPGATPQQPSPGPRPQVTPQQRTRRGRALLRPVTVDDVVAEDVVTVQRDTPVRTAVAKMSDSDVGSVVVVDDRQPVGVLTDRTIALALEDQPNVADRSAEELTDGKLITVDASTTIFEALQLMNDEGIRRLPVVDDDGRLQGIVTLDDALVLLANELDKIASTVREQSPRL